MLLVAVVGVLGTPPATALHWADTVTVSPSIVTGGTPATFSIAVHNDLNYDYLSVYKVGAKFCWSGYVTFKEDDGTFETVPPQRYLTLARTATPPVERDTRSCQVEVDVVAEAPGEGRTMAVYVAVITLQQHQLFPLRLTISADPIRGPSPLTVAFRGQAVGGVGPYTFLWDFGDGAVSNETNPRHEYRGGGAFNVRTRVIDSESRQAWANASIFVDPDHATTAALAVGGTSAVGAVIASVAILAGRRARRRRRKRL